MEQQYKLGETVWSLTSQMVPYEFVIKRISIHETESSREIFYSQNTSKSGDCLQTECFNSFKELIEYKIKELEQLREYKYIDDQKAEASLDVII